MVFQDALLNSLTNPNWKPENMEFEKEQAFNDGFKKGIDASQFAMQDYFAKNIKKATKITESLIRDFLKLEFINTSVLLKIQELDSFEILFIVEKNYFLSPQKKEAYKILRETKKKNNNSKFNIDFLMMPNDNSLNENLIKSDGFVLKYEPKTR